MAKDPFEEEDGRKSKIEDSFDIVGLLLDYLNHWKWFVLSAGLFGVAAYFYVSTIIPTYTVNASIYLNDESSTSGSQAILGINNPLEDFAQTMDETEIAILLSRNNLIKIVDSLDLAYKYYRIGTLRDEPVYRNSPVLVSLDSISLANLSTPIEIMIDRTDKGYEVTSTSRHEDGDDRQVNIVKKLPATIQLSQGALTLRQSPFTKKFTETEKVVIYNPNSVAASLSDNLFIGFAKNTQSILRLELLTTIIPEGRDVLRVLIDFYNRQIIEDKNRSAIQTEAFILDRLVMISGELRDVENRLKDYRETHNIANLDAQTSMNLSNLSSTQSDLAAVDAEREILNDIEREVSHQDSYTTLPSVANNPAVAQSIEAYNKAVINYEHALESRGSEHPQVQRMQANLNQQKAQIISTLNAAKRDVAARRRGIVNLDNRSSSQLAVQPTVDKGLNEIFREQQVKVNIYTFLLQKREEIALQKTLATPTAQFIDNPAGSGPIAPKRMMFICMGLLLGFILPAVIILLKRIIFPKFNDKTELERVTSVPILGEICHNPDGDDICINEGVSTPIAELFRLLRNNINFVNNANDNKVILVTSSISGEGKTFIALNLAMTYALTGKRVIVIGLDIRRPVLAHICNMSNVRGVTTYISGQESDLNSLVQVSNFNPNLSILPAGPIPPNPNELLMNSRMSRMFEQLRAEYDYVIVDSAPIGLVSDTFLIVKHSDIQLYVTRAGYSNRTGLKILHDAINDNRMPHTYIVLNGVKISGGAYNYRHYGYYYSAKESYGYTYGYGSKKRKAKKKGFLRRLFSRKSKR